jgi:hypothetical protein
MRRLVVVGVAAVAALALAACGNEHKGEHCVEHHIRTTYIMAGKVMVPSEEKVCDRWVPDAR